MRSASPEPHGPARPHPAIFVPPRRRHPDHWLDRRCDEVISPAVRSALWRFVCGTIPVTHPDTPEPAGTPRLSGLNDGRGAAVKIAMLSTERSGVCLVLRAGPGEPDPGPGPHRPWRQALGRPGVRAGATVVTGIDQVAPADVAALLAGCGPGDDACATDLPDAPGLPAAPSRTPPGSSSAPSRTPPGSSSAPSRTPPGSSAPSRTPPGLSAAPSPQLPRLARAPGGAPPVADQQWLVVRLAVPEGIGTLSVDPGDGLLRPVLDFTVLGLGADRPPGERPTHCPRCTGGRVRRYATFDLCPDCGWLARGQALIRSAPAP
ncbi:hypothetical protein [Actinoplanes sp. NPDC051859]|uniref:hypothetical protein n=1 Tax=Actinoplanes sp. NPDC051859 TaxID=3363909 RepID=UPI0037BCCFAE